MVSNPKQLYEPGEFENPSNLSLDLNNPRVGSVKFANEDKMLEYLVTNADIDELVQSIRASGWLDYEPLIVMKEQGKTVVLEGNRRLAALRILSSPEVRSRLKIKLSKESGNGALPQQVRVRRVASRKDARDYIGFKHINGAFKWDPLAKAKYAAEWFEDGHDIKRISQRLGDSHNTVVRLVNGWRVLEQSEKNGFDRKKTTRASFPLSHLYTALSRPSVRSYLGLSTYSISDALKPDPVPPEHQENLLHLMSWLYGQDPEPAVLRSQNPDLNRIVEVLGNEQALEKLTETRNLNAAYDLIEDKERKFYLTLTDTILHAEETLKLVGNFDGRADWMSSGQKLFRTVWLLRAAMREARDMAESGESPDDD